MTKTNNISFMVDGVFLLFKSFKVIDGLNLEIIINGFRSDILGKELFCHNDKDLIYRGVINQIKTFGNIDEGVTTAIFASAVGADAKNCRCNPMFPMSETGEDMRPDPCSDPNCIHNNNK